MPKLWNANRTGDVMDTGINIGSSYVKAVMDKRTVSFPSVVGTYDITDFGFGMSSADIIAFPELEVLVGNAAVTTSGYTFRRESRDWILSDEWLHLFYAAMSELTQATNVDVTVVTGLPIAFYADKELVQKRLLGKHSFRREGRALQHVNVTQVRVIPESFGTLFYKAMDASGKIIDGLLQKKVAILDVGSKTTNGQVVQNMEALKAESFSVDIGCWDIARKMRGWLGNKFPRLELKDHQILDIITSGKVSYDGDMYNVVDNVANYTANMRKAIEAALSQYWDDNSGSYDVILLTGGGYGIIKDTILKKYKQAEVVDQPVMANAQGMYRFARYLSNASRA